MPVPKEVIPVPPLATGKISLTPVVKERSVQFERLPDAGVPNAGVTNVGLVANTRAPVPVSSVMAAAKLALEGVARKAATLLPRPLIPVDTGRPVQLVRVPDEGVPSTPLLSTLELIAAAMLVNSVENSVPLITFAGLPVARVSLAPKLVVTV
jgi:hypothetical protein